MQCRTNIPPSVTIYVGFNLSLTVTIIVFVFPSSDCVSAVTVSLKKRAAQLAASLVPAFVVFRKNNVRCEMKMQLVNSFTFGDRSPAGLAPGPSITECWAEVFRSLWGNLRKYW